MKNSLREKKAVGYFARYLLPFKRHLVAIFFLMLVSTALTLSVPLLIKPLLDEGLVRKDLAKITLFLGLLFLTGFLYEGFATLMRYLGTYVSHKFTYSISRDLFGKLLHFPLTFFEKFHLDEITARVNDDIEKLGVLLGTVLIPGIAKLCLLLGTVFIMSRLHFGLFLAACLMIPVIVLLEEKLAARQKMATKKVQSQFEQKSKTVQEIISGIQEVKVLHIEKWAERQFASAQHHIFREQMWQRKIGVQISLVVRMIKGLFHIVVYLYGAVALIRGEISLGTLFAFLVYFHQTLVVVEGIPMWNRALPPYLISLDRVYEFFTSEENEVEPLPETPLPENYRSNALVQFIQVTFSYPEANQVLPPLNLTIMPGEKVAVFGQDGSSKSAILKLLAGLVQPNGGKIFFNGFALSTWQSSELAKKISYVTQKPFLFQTTIRQNLLLGNFAASDTELLQVLSRVGLKEFIFALPAGINTRLTVGEPAISGEQLARLALARALLRNTDLLLLDEPMSTLEEKSTEELIHNLFHNYPELTVIMIVNNERLLRHFDRIFELDESGISDREILCTAVHHSAVQ